MAVSNQVLLVASILEGKMYRRRGNEVILGRMGKLGMVSLSDSLTRLPLKSLLENRDVSIWLQCFPSNIETFLGNIMFLQQCF